MYTLKLQKLTVSVDFQAGHVDAVQIGDRARLASRLPVFKIGLRRENGEPLVLSAYDAKQCAETENGAVYTGFSLPQADVSLPAMRVQVSLTDENGEAAWRIAVETNDQHLLTEWVDFPLLSLPRLRDNNPDGTGGTILHPFNEGALVSDISLRDRSDFRHWEPLYPSLGCYSVFPNMICSQMMAYLWDDMGLYVGAHDPQRGVKAIDFYEEGEGITLQIRLFCGVDFGEPYAPDFPIVWSVTESTWESAADRYRAWFEGALPADVRRINENPDLPAWYEDSPLVVSYPIRGVHDTDEMTPNALYPYTNALPLIDCLRAVTESRILVLLMHWEGTAPWAPPYVWPPYGDPDNFSRFMSSLHERGDLLGVYCSGFGYTIQSNLVPYDCRDAYEQKGLSRGMCAGYDGRVAVSKICTAQRKGYDICPASEVGRSLLDEAYQPLFDGHLDYVQILDQNHGGGQYFCHSRNHGHPPAPGAWMTTNMQGLLKDWHRQSAPALLGCESAAAEPFIGHLQFSDNRFELNYIIGRPVPLYAYLYHEYVRNFMGNQVCCQLCGEEDTLRYRMAYSFSIGDAMTIVLSPNGDLLPNWGTRDFTNLPDKDKTLRFIANVTRFYRERAKPYLYAGRMITPPQISLGSVTYHMETFPGRRPIVLPELLSSAWEGADGSRAVILVNPHDAEKICTVNGRSVTVPALDAVILPMA